MSGSATAVTSRTQATVAPRAANVTSDTAAGLDIQDGFVTQRTLDDLGIKAHVILGAERLKTSGAHAIYKGVNAQGQKVIVKDNSQYALPTTPVAKVWGSITHTLGGALFPNSGRLENINDIVMRQIFRNNIDCPVIPAAEAVIKDPETGQLHFGIQTPFVENMGSLADGATVPPVSNPAQAARGVVYSSLLMGNWDSTWHEDNNNEITADGHMSNGTALVKGNYIQADMGWGGQRGNSVMGIPFGSLELLHSLPPADVHQAVDEVLHLTDQQLHDWVSTAGQQTITGWNDDLCNFYTDALVSNRNSLAHQLEEHPDWLENRKDEGLRGPNETWGQTFLSPFASGAKSIERRTSHILDHVTTNDAMVKLVTDAVKREQFPSSHTTVQA